MLQLRIILAHYGVEAAEFGHITGGRTCAVSFHQAQSMGREPGIIVGPPQRLGLALGARRVNALELAVAGGANPFDHRIDAVTVALGIIQAF